MLEHIFRSHERIQALREGPRGSLLEGFAEELHQTNYANITARRHIRAAEHLIHWMERAGRPISDLTENFLEQFDQHLERCRCPGFGPTRLDPFRDARLFVEHLRSTSSLTAIAPVKEDPLCSAPSGSG